MNYKIDAARWFKRDVHGEDPTGISVRATSPDGSTESVDIFFLELPSLKAWLRSRGGENEWAETVVAMLLGHRNA